MADAVFERVEVLCIKSFAYGTAYKRKAVHIGHGLRDLHTPFVAVLSHSECIGLRPLVAAKDKPHSAVAREAVVKIQCALRNGECE